MTTAIEIKTFTVSYQGDMAVGENSRHYELTGPFLFQEQAELDAFKERLSDAFEYCEDGRPTDIFTNLDFERWEEGQRKAEAELAEIEEEFSNSDDEDDLFHDEWERDEFGAK